MGRSFFVNLPRGVNKYIRVVKDVKYFYVYHQSVAHRRYLVYCEIYIMVIVATSLAGQSCRTVLRLQIVDYPSLCST